MYGVPKVLTSAEELILINWILMMLTIGYPVTKLWMLDEVEFILKLDGHETLFTMTWPGKSWYQHFANEHKEVTERIAQGVSKPCADVMSWNIGSMGVPSTLELYLEAFKPLQTQNTFGMQMKADLYWMACKGYHKRC